MPSAQAQAPPILAPAMSASPPALEDAPRETTAVRTPLVEPGADGESDTGDERCGEDQGRERKETFHAAHASPEPNSGKVCKFLLSRLHKPTARPTRSQGNRPFS